MPANHVAENTRWEGVSGDGFVQFSCDAERVLPPSDERLHCNALVPPANRPLAVVAEELDLPWGLGRVAVVRGVLSSGGAVEDKDRVGEDILLEIEASWSASVRQRQPVVDLEDSGGVATVPVVYDLYYSESPFFERAESEGGEAVSGYIMTLHEEIMHGFSDRDLGGGVKLSQGPDDGPDLKSGLVPLGQQDVRYNPCHHTERVRIAGTCVVLPVSGVTADFVAAHPGPGPFAGIDPDTRSPITLVRCAAGEWKASVRWVAAPPGKQGKPGTPGGLQSEVVRQSSAV